MSFIRTILSAVCLIQMRNDGSKVKLIQVQQQQQQQQQQKAREQKHKFFSFPSEVLLPLKVNPIRVCLCVYYFDTNRGYGFHYKFPPLLLTLLLLLR